MRSFLKKLVITVCAVAGVTAVAPQVTHAHAVLDTSSPAASSVIKTTPTEISLRFNESVEEELASIRLFGADQIEISIGAAKRDSSDHSHVTANIATDGIQLADGNYVVVWRVVSADGHPANGAFPFEIGEQSTGTGAELLNQVLKGVDAESPLSNPLAASRLIAYLAAIVLMGLVVFTWTLSSVTARQIRLARLSSLALFVGSALTFLLQGPYVAGKSWGVITDTGLMGDVLGTRLGIALVVRCALACVWGALAITIGGHTSALWKNVAFAASVATVFTFATSGHASAGSLPLLFITIDALHLLGIAVWVGGLLVMSLGSDHEQTSVARFSRLATWAMPLTVVTGIVQGLHLMGGLGDVTSTTFGKLLILKTALVVCVIYLGMRARRKIENSDSPLQSIVRREAAIVLIVLAVTSLMVGKTPSATEGAASQTFTTTQLQGDVLANIEIAPTKVGVMAVHVILSPPGGALSPVKTVEVQMSLASKNIPPIPVNMVSLGPNHWSGIVQIPYSGTWDVEARVKPTETSTLLYVVQVKVKG